MIDVGEKHVQCLHPLDAATLNGAPLAGGNTARDDVEGNQPLGALIIAIQGEGDTCAVEQQIGFTATLGQQFIRCIRQPAGKGLIVRANSAARVIHLIIKGAAHAVLLVARTWRQLCKARAKQ